MSTATLVAAVLIAAGRVGVVVPLLPGPLLVGAGVAVWSIERADPTGWLVLAAALAVLLTGQVAKYLVPGRQLREAAVPWQTLAAGVVGGIVGFVVVPVLGLPVGFVGGVYLAESARLGGPAAAWPSTRSAVVAVGVSLLIEFGSGLLAAGIWLLGVVLG